MCCCDLLRLLFLTLCSPLSVSRFALWVKKKGRERKEVSSEEQKAHSPGRRRTVYSHGDYKKKKKSSLRQRRFDVWTSLRVPLGRPPASSPRAAALTYPRHLGGPLRAANTDPRGPCFSAQAALLGAQSCGTDSCFNSAELVPDL